MRMETGAKSCASVGVRACFGDVLQPPAQNTQVISRTMAAAAVRVTAGMYARGATCQRTPARYNRKPDAELVAPAVGELQRAAHALRARHARGGGRAAGAGARADGRARARSCIGHGRLPRPPARQ